MEDFSKKSEEELLEVIRRGENSNVPGSSFQRAKTELELRDREVKNTRTIGILNEGDNTTVVNTTFKGLNIGIKSTGKALSVINSKLDNEESIKKVGWYDTVLGKILIGVIISIIISILTYVLGLVRDFLRNKN